MARRHAIAFGLQQGASNPIAITVELKKAVDEVLIENGHVATDPAVRLICHQLSSVLNVQNLPLEMWQEMMDECLKKSP